MKIRQIIYLPPPPCSYFLALDRHVLLRQPQRRGCLLLPFVMMNAAGQQHSSPISQLLIRLNLTHAIPSFAGELACCAPGVLVFYSPIYTHPYLSIHHTEYGVQAISDLREFDDEELQESFGLKPVQIKKLRLAQAQATASAGDGAVEQIVRRQSFTDDAVVNAWGLSAVPGGSTVTTTAAGGAAGAAAPTLSLVTLRALISFSSNRIIIIRRMLPLIAKKFALGGAGLGSFSTAFENLGMTEVGSLKDHDLLQDDELLRQIGMSDKQINTFRQVVFQQAHPSPLIKAAQAGGAGIEPVRRLDSVAEASGNTSQPQDSLRMQQTQYDRLQIQQQQHNAAVRERQMLQMQQFSGNAKPPSGPPPLPPPPPLPQQGQFLERSVFGRRGGSAGHPGGQSAEGANGLFSTGDLMAVRGSTGGGGTISFEELSRSGRDPSGAQHRTAFPPPPPPAPPTPPAPRASPPPPPPPPPLSSPQQPAASPVDSDPDAAALRKGLGSLPKDEHAKVIASVNKSLAGLLVAPENGKYLVRPTTTSAAGASSWLREVGTLLPQAGGGAGGGLKNSLDASHLAMHRLVEKAYQQLNGCDRLRQKRMPFDDNQLMGFEKRLLVALRTFTSTPFKLLADTPYIHSMMVSAG